MAGILYTPSSSILKSIKRRTRSQLADVERLINQCVDQHLDDFDPHGVLADYLSVFRGQVKAFEEADDIRSSQIEVLTIIESLERVVAVIEVLKLYDRKSVSESIDGVLHKLKWETRSLQSINDLTHVGGPYTLEETK